MHRASLAARTWLAVGGAVHVSPAVAAAPVYFDIGGLLLYALGAIFGLLIFPICVAIAKSKESKRLYGLLSLACIVALAVPVVRGYLQDRQYKDGVLADADTFANYCTSGRQPLLYPELVAAPAALRVRHETVTSGPQWIGGAGGIVRRIRQDQAFCSRSGITIIVPASPAVGEEAQYPVCATEGAALASSVEYELLVRDSYESKKGTGHVPWGLTVMYRSSMVLTRKADKQIVAESDFYFVAPRIVPIEARCPKTDEAILQFLVKALPKG
jgi:hypothetical protein